MRMRHAMAAVSDEEILGEWIYAGTVDAIY